VTLDRTTASELERPIESLQDLVDYFRSGEKPRARWRVGIEHEKLSLRTGVWEPVPYEGERGVEALLRRLAAEPGWRPLAEDGRVVGLDGEGLGVSLEPGAQVELNGRPVASLRDTQRELLAHLALLRRLAEPLGIRFLGLGAHPFHPTKELPQVPRERYRIMRRYLPARGELALDMMHATASVQASLDYADEADLVDKMRAALAVTPIAAALFANSSLALGRPSGFVSRRLHIWQHTDPERTGLLPFAFDADFGYARYAEWALDVPMFFLVRDGGYRAMEGKTFRRFWREGHEGERASIADFERHLTTLFPEVRLKRLLELRCADAVPVDLLCGVPALWKGVLYDAEARAAARALAGDWSPEQRAALHADVARRGLGAEVPGTQARTSPLATRARELVAIARAGLRRQAIEAGLPDEGALLDPVEVLAERGKSPGQIVLERWQGDWAGNPDRLIDYARY
jgi:glutamate--cysteine ligase